MVRAASDARLQTLILRPRAVFGEGDRAILPRLLAAAQRGWFPLVEGSDLFVDEAGRRKGAAAQLLAEFNENCFTRQTSQQLPCCPK